MENLYGPFIAGRALPVEVAEYLWKNGFRSADALKLLPVSDLHKLATILPDCPNINLIAVRLAITQLVNDILTDAPPQPTPMPRAKPAKPPVAPRPTITKIPSQEQSSARVDLPAPVVTIPSHVHEEHVEHHVTVNDQPIQSQINVVDVPRLTKLTELLDLSGEKITVPLLGNQCQIGQLYDSANSRFISEKCLSDNEIKEHAQTETLAARPVISAHNMATISGRLDALGLADDVEFRMNVLLGLTSYHGAAKKLLDMDFTAPNVECFCIRFSSRTEQILVHRPVTQVHHNATHVVTRTVSGLEQFCVFTEKRGDLSTRLEQRVAKIVSALTTDLPSAPRPMEFPLSDDEQDTHCDYFGDDTARARSTTIFEAFFELNRFREGRKQIPQEPKAVVLQPLMTDEKSKAIPQDFAERTEHLFSIYEQMKCEILSVITEEEAANLPSDFLSTIKGSVDGLKQKLREFLVDIVRKYRAGQLDKTKLFEELSKIEGALNGTAVEQITQQMSDYCNKMREALTQVLKAEIPVNPENYHQQRPSLVLTINLSPLQTICQSITNLFRDESENFQEETSFYYPDNIRLTTEAFVDFHRTNAAKVAFICCVANIVGNNPVFVQYYGDETEPETVSIPTPVRAEAIQATSISPTSILLNWNTNEGSPYRDYSRSLLTGYRITVSNVTENLTDTCNSREKCKEFLVTGLKENTVYAFQIQPLCRDGLQMDISLPSNLFRTTEPERLAHRALESATLTTKDPIPTYRLARRTVLHDEANGISRYAIGTETPNQIGEKLLLLVGGTGSGKSTLVNSIVNFLYDVRVEDKFRLKLISEDDEFEESQTKEAGRSKTRYISAYQFHDTQLPYRLTIVDTPGFGDTEGLDKDRKTTDYMKAWFATGAVGEQKLIDAVCLVVKSTEVRVTGQVRHELKSVIDLFGRDMEKNILTLFTFCDGARVTALEALKAVDVPVNAFFKFNNSAIFLDLENDDMQKIFWRRAYDNYKAFFVGLEELQPKSLALSLEVLHVREEVELRARWLTERVREEIEHVHSMTQLFQLIDQHRMDIDKHKHFKTTQKIRQRREIKLPDGVLATTCMQCNYTCHTSCNVKENGALYWCGTMGIVIRPTEKQLKLGGKGFDGAFKYTFVPTEAQEAAQKREACCTICEPRCHWTKHVNRNYRIVFEDVVREITDENIYNKYKIAVNEVNRTEKLVEQMTNQFIAMEQRLSNTVTEIRQLLNKLDEIALRSGQMTDGAYIKMMIESEKSEMRDGYQHRLDILHRHLNTIELISRARRGENLLQQVENDAFEFLKARFPDLYANISSARHFRETPAAIKPRGLYPALDVLND